MLYSIFIVQSCLLPSADSKRYLNIRLERSETMPALGEFSKGTTIVPL